MIYIDRIRNINRQLSYHYSNLHSLMLILLTFVFYYYALTHYLYQSLKLSKANCILINNTRLLMLNHKIIEVNAKAKVILSRFGQLMLMTSMFSRFPIHHFHDRVILLSCPESGRGLSPPSSFQFPNKDHVVWKSIIFI